MYMRDRERERERDEPLYNGQTSMGYGYRLQDDCLFIHCNLNK